MNFGFQILDVRFGISDFRFQDLDFKFWISDFRFGTPDFELWTSDFGSQVSDSFQVFDFRFRFRISDLS